MNLFRRLLLLLLVAGRSCLAEEMSADRVKSAYVLNFAKFVEWPAGTVWSGDKAKLCVIGSNVLGGALLELDGRKAGNRGLIVVQFANAARNLGSCNMIFIGESEQQHVVSILKSLGEAPVLTISDIEGFAERGGGIGLRFLENKVVFEVNIVAVQKVKLHLPGQLLNLASSVFGR